MRGRALGNTIAPNGVGKLHLENGTAADAKEYSYDSLGRNSEVTTAIDGTLYHLTTTYDAYSRADTITYPISTQYPTGLVIQNSYTDAATDGSEGYLKAVTNPIVFTVYWRAMSQNAAGQLTEVKLGNGITSQYFYDAQTNLIESITSATPGGTGLHLLIRFCFKANARWGNHITAQLNQVLTHSCDTAVIPMLFNLSNNDNST